ncbi:MAG TPA: DUF58 domain-containing protein [Marinagarivorans sp.]
MRLSRYLPKFANAASVAANDVANAPVYTERKPNRWQARFFRWIDKKRPASRSVLLTRKNLYTFPTLMGFGFLGLSLLLWLLGTNYQNNLILALSYLLMSLVVVAILHTYANLAGLRIKVLGAKPAFAGETVYFILQVEGARAKGCDNLTIRWWNGDDACFDFEPDGDGKHSAQIQVGVHAVHRGYLDPGKLLLESTFPLGLIRCWTWLNLDARAVVFPKPLKVQFPPQVTGENEGEGGEYAMGGDDFAGLKEYRAGDPIKHIAWKHFAREQGLYSKEYASAIDSDTWLEWNSFLQLAPEDRLSALCYWALEFDRLGIAYGLRLPGKQIPPAVDDGHRLTVLSALARFDTSLGGQ